MDIGSIITTVYFVVGGILTFYWFNKEYSENYEKQVKDGLEEKGMVNIFLLLLWVFWPIKLIKNIIRRKKI
jgi:hypothetical protein